MKRLNIDSPIHGIKFKDFPTQEALDDYMLPITEGTNTHWGVGAIFSQEDVTDRYFNGQMYDTAADAQEARRLIRIKFADEVFAELATMNVIDIQAGRITIENLLIAENKLKDVQRQMQNSSTELAFAAIQSLDIPELYIDTKNYIIAKIQAFLAAGG